VLEYGLVIAFVVVAIANEIERSYAIVIAADRFAIDDAGA
jgi:hypothetical protein